jgi:cyclophilin family peptidyl-prolyl cis-trans isomerase/HEAT repeat protein
MRKLFLPTLLFSLILSACVPYQEETVTEVKLSFLQADQQKVYDFQDKQQKDSLLKYLSHPSPSLRFLATRAFASFKDSTIIDSLATRLDDEVEEIRIAAAYALGQIGAKAGADYLADAFHSDDSIGNHRLLNSTILEAAGKCGDQKYLEFLSKIQTYRPKDTLLLIGQCRGLYRFGLRNMASPQGTERMVSIVTSPSYPQEARFWAAHYLFRTRGLQLGSYTDQLSEAFQGEKDPRTRMALAVALGKTKGAGAGKILKNRFAKEKDYRVRCNILRGLTNFPADSVKAHMYTALNDPNPHVSRMAAEYFLENGTAREAAAYRERALDTSLYWRTQVIMLGAANYHLPTYFVNTRDGITYDLEKRLENNKDPYIKAAVIEALSQHPWNYQKIVELGMDDEYAFVRNATMEGIARICRHPRFDYIFGASRRRVRQELTDILVDAINSGDVGKIAVAAGVFPESSIDFKRIVFDTGFLTTAKEKLELPREIEAYYELEKALAYFEDREPEKRKTPEYNHQIRWDLVEIVEPGTRVILYTNKGNIVLSFLEKEAPGSVANFIELARNGFFKKKTFHRVVPNFVIQGGCPRGDGYGALDYTIRSELPQLYYAKAGMVGMASAGNHTEGTQFFITHSPSPHLDGKYTIFAQVEEGMDIVHKIEVGDYINKVEIQ